MRPESSEFSHAPDRALGRALRAVLDRPGDAEFAAGVVARARAAGVGSSRAVLGRWARAAVAGAAVAALAAGFLGGTGRQAAAPFETEWATTTTGSPVAAALFTAGYAPDVSILFASTADE